MAGFTAAVDVGGASTGYALHRPVPSREESFSVRSSRNVQPLPMTMSAGGEGGIQGSMWKGKFRRRCAAVSRRKGGAVGGEGSLEPRDAVGEDEHAEAEHEEVSRLVSLCDFIGSDNVLRVADFSTDDTERTAEDGAQDGRLIRTGSWGI